MLLKGFGGRAAAVSERGVIGQFVFCFPANSAAVPRASLMALRHGACLQDFLGVAPLGGMGIDDAGGGSGHCVSIDSGYKKPYCSQASQCRACSMSRELIVVLMRMECQPSALFFQRWAGGCAGASAKAVRCCV